MTKLLKYLKYVKKHVQIFFFLNNENLKCIKILKNTETLSENIGLLKHNYKHDH